jgi:hypothetical protein
VISQDRRWSRYVAFESEASDLTRGDTNGAKDVFVVRRDRRRVLVGAVVRRLPLVCQERSLRSSQYEDPVPPAAPPQRPPPENRQVYMRYLGPV